MHGPSNLDTNSKNLSEIETFSGLPQCKAPPPIEHGEPSINTNNFPPSIAFWNCSGYGRLYEIDIDTIKHLTSNNIICLSETWNTSTLNPITLPSFLGDFTQYISPATKEKSKGRASGGLLLLIKNNRKTDSKVISITNIWIIVHVKLLNFNFILGLVYFKPDNNHNFYISQLNDTINDLTSFYPNLPIILIGDYNARIGQLNQFEEQIFLNTNFTGKRQSLDKIENERGKLLCDCMQEHGFIILNGRSQSDASGEFTFLSHMGKSLIDMCWVNANCLDLIKDFKVQLNIHSEHAIISINFQEANSTPYFEQHKRPYSQKLYKFNWKLENLTSFTNSLKELPHIYFNSNSPTELSNNLQEAILLSAVKSDMLKSCSNYWHNKPNHKPWYNSECKILKKNLKKELKYLKESNYSKNSLIQYMANKKLNQKKMSI